MLKKLTHESYNNFLEDHFSEEEYFDMESEFLDLPENWESYNFELEQYGLD